MSLGGGFDYDLSKTVFFFEIRHILLGGGPDYDLALSSTEARICLVAMISVIQSEISALVINDKRRKVCAALCGIHNAPHLALKHLGMHAVRHILLGSAATAKVDKR